MTKPRPRFRHRSAVFLMRRKKRIKSNFSQRDNHTDFFEQFELLNEVRPTTRKFHGSRFVGRRRTPNSGSNITVRELETVVSMQRLRLIGKSRSVKRSVEPIAAAVTRKHSAGPIPSMRCRRQTHDKQPRIWIAESRQGSRPIFLTSVAARRFFSDQFAPAHQPRAFATSKYRSVKLLKTIHGLSISTTRRRWSILLSVVFVLVYAFSNSPVGLFRLFVKARIRNCAQQNFFPLTILL
jgi:hypothetical protein